MVEGIRGGGPGRFESNERIRPVDVNFLKLGGTWDMIERDGQRIGSGTLDDDELAKMQTEAGIFAPELKSNLKQRTALYRKLAGDLYTRFSGADNEQLDAPEHLSSWAVNRAGERFGDYVKGPFIPLFSGDSSHLRNYIAAPMVTNLIERAIREPHKPLLGGQGTDTADIALLGLFDAFTYDTKLPPLILAGANHPKDVPKSDAPSNFVDLAKLAHIDLDSGGYWVFQGNLYRASDFSKIDPEESRPLEEQRTFFSSHQTQEKISNLLDRVDKLKADWSLRTPPSEDHIVHSLTSETLYDALRSIYIEDLGNKNEDEDILPHLYNPEKKAFIIAAHSLGNIDNPLRAELVNAAREGKLIIGTSRTLIGDTTLDYAASLFGANKNPTELAGSGKQIIAAHKLSRTVAHSIAARAVLEGLDQAQTQALFDKYARSRRLIGR